MSDRTTHPQSTVATAASVNDTPEEGHCKCCTQLSELHKQALLFMKQSEDVLNDLSRKQKSLKEWEATLTRQEAVLRTREATLMHQSENPGKPDAQHDDSRCSDLHAEANTGLRHQLLLAEIEKRRMQRELLDIQKQQTQLHTRDERLYIMPGQGASIRRPSQTRPPFATPGSTDLLRLHETATAAMKI